MGNKDTDITNITITTGRIVKADITTAPKTHSKSNNMNEAMLFYLKEKNDMRNIKMQSLLDPNCGIKADTQPTPQAPSNPNTN